MKLMSFQDAITATENRTKHLLLGNGFSVALKPDIFSYDALISRASFDKDSTIAKVFEIIGNNDFEAAVNAIESAALVTPVYAKADQDTLTSMTNDALTIKNKLIELVIGSHPDRPYDITDQQRDHCINFLRNFNGKLFTLNYDILLYWVLMDAKERKILDFDDGFRSDQDEADTPYVVWNNGEGHRQTVCYIHGALHLFDAKHQLRKYTWKRTDIPLIEQARAAISEGAFPLFVSEGTSSKKMAKISHSGYLHKAYRTLCSNSGVIFVHGFSMDENDSHIITAIEKHYSKVYISIYGDPENERNRKTIARAEQMKTSNTKLSIYYYDSSSAKVWGS